MTCTRAIASRFRSRRSTSKRSARIDAAVVAYPHAAAAPTVGALRERGVRVVDLSADFRLSSLATYERWYGAHPRPDLLAQAVYGLTELPPRADRHRRPRRQPRLLPDRVAARPRAARTRRLIADVVIDAKQGISGAGRTFDETTHQSMAGENILPYKVAEHRHTPEIEEQLAPLRAAGGARDEVAVLFQAHLVPLDQGELVDCYVTPTREVRDDELLELYVDAYRREPSVEVVAAPPGTREVQETNFLPRVRQGRPPQRQGDRAQRDRQPLEGHLLAGRAEPQRDVRPARARGADVSREGTKAPGTNVFGGLATGPPRPFFHSRWVPVPEHVRDPRARRRPAGRVSRRRRRLWDQAERQPRRGPARV